MAWLPPSCNPLDRRLWLPGGRTESLFPLGPQRRSWTISPPTATRLPSPRLASGLSGTTHTPSPPCASSSPDPCSAYSADARSAAFHFYNTVVLGATRATPRANATVTIKATRFMTSLLLFRRGPRGQLTSSRHVGQTCCVLHFQHGIKWV